MRLISYGKCNSCPIAGILRMILATSTGTMFHAYVTVIPALAKKTDRISIVGYNSHNFVEETLRSFY